MRERRSSQRRRLTARLPVLLLALAAALAALLGGVGVGQARTAVSLIEVEGGGIRIGFDGERALHFTERTAAPMRKVFITWMTTSAPGSGRFLTTVHDENGSTQPQGEAAHVAGTFKNRMRQLSSGGVWGSSTSNVAWARITG